MKKKIVTVVLVLLSLAFALYQTDLIPPILFPDRFIAWALRHGDLSHLQEPDLPILFPQESQHPTPSDRLPYAPPPPPPRLEKPDHPLFVPPEFQHPSLSNRLPYAAPPPLPPRLEKPDRPIFLPQALQHPSPLNRLPYAAPPPPPPAAPDCETYHLGRKLAVDCQKAPTSNPPPPPPPPPPRQ